MKACEYLSGCAYFKEKMAELPRASEAIKRVICYQDWNNCARHLVREELGAGSVPVELVPTDREMADQLILAAKK